MSESRRSPFPLRDFMGRVRTRFQIAGDAGVLALFAEDGNLQMVIGVLNVASEMEITPEWQALRMKMLSSVKHEQKLMAQNLANQAARKYEA